MYAIFIVHSDVCVHTLYTFRSQDKQQKQLYTFMEYVRSTHRHLATKGLFLHLSSRKNHLITRCHNVIIISRLYLCHIHSTQYWAYVYVLIINFWKWWNGLAVHTIHIKPGCKLNRWVQYFIIMYSFVHYRQSYLHLVYRYTS